MSCEGYPTASNMKLLATDAQTINEVVTSAADLTTPASDGLQKTTLTSIENKVTDAISNSFSAYIGDWVIGLTFNAPNEYAVFNGVSYKPKSGTVLPYVAQGADPTLSPDVENVEPFSDINTSNIYANAGGKKNEINNPQFIVVTPDTSVTQPSATPTNYLEGEQIFSGWFVGAGGATNLTYVNGLVNADSGVIHYLVPSSGALESLNDFTASVAGLNLKPKTDGVTFLLGGSNYKIEVDFSIATDVFSVKFEAGTVATGHDVKSLFDIYGDPAITGVHDIRAYGAVANGDEITNIDALSAAITAASETNGTVYIADLQFPIKGTRTILGAGKSVKISGSGQIQSPFSEDIEDTTERPSGDYLSGIFFSGFDKVVVSGIKIRGAFLGNTGCRIFKVDNVYAYNLQNALISMSGTLEKVSLINSTVRYHIAVSPTANFGVLNYSEQFAETGNVIIKNTNFFGVAAAATLDAPIDNVTIDTCGFYGCNVNCLKTTFTSGNYTVTNSYFDATPINQLSQNRHLQGSFGVCGMFLNSFYNLVVMGNTFTNFGKYGSENSSNGRVIKLWQGSQYDSTISVRDNKFIDNTREIIGGVQGSVLVSGNDFVRSAIEPGDSVYADVLSGVSNYRVKSVRFIDNNVTNGTISIFNNALYSTDIVRVTGNVFNNDGLVIGDIPVTNMSYALRTGNYLTSENTINISNGTKVFSNTRARDNFISNPTGDTGFEEISSGDLVEFNDYNYVSRNMNQNDTLTLHSNVSKGCNRGRVSLCIATNTTSASDSVMMIVGWNAINGQEINRTISNVNNSGSFSVINDEIVFTSTNAALRVWSFSSYPLSF